MMPIFKKLYTIAPLLLLSFLSFGNSVYAQTPTPTASLSPSATIVSPGTLMTLTGSISGSGYVGSNCWAIVNGGSAPSSCWYPTGNGTIPSGVVSSHVSTFTTGSADANTYHIYLCSDGFGYCAETHTLQVQNPTITWNPPTSMFFGTALSSTQLNASGNVPGTMSYSPASGASLGIGLQQLSATFTPTVGSPVTEYKYIDVVDNTPPSSTTLTATGATSASIGLSWTLPTDNVGVVAYDIHRCSGTCTPNPSASPVPLATVPVASGTTYSDTGLPVSSTYSYLVRVRDAAGNASISNTSTATTFADTTPPSPAPTLTPTAVSMSQINISWGASTDSGGSGLAPYELYSCSGSCTPNTSGTAIYTGTATSYSHTGLSLNSTYSYRAVAKDNAGNASISATAFTTTLSDTTPPSTSTITATGASMTSIGLSWTLPTDNVGVVAYDIHRCSGTCTPNPSASPVPLATVPVESGTTYADSGLSPSSTYSYLVRVRDAAGNASISNTSTATTFADTTAPIIGASANPTATANSMTQITLSNFDFVDNVAVTGYNIYQCSGASCTPTFLTTSATASYVHTGLSPNTQYSYRVRAVDAAGNLSSYTSTFSATTQDGGNPVGSASLSPSATIVAPNTLMTLSGSITGPTNYTGTNCWVIVAGSASPSSSSCWYPSGNGVLPSGLGSWNSTFTTGSPDSNIYHIYLCANGPSGTCFETHTLQVVANTYNITASAGANGSVNCTGCGSSVTSGSIVSVVATPDPNYKVSNWGGLGSSCTGNDCFIFADANGSITVTFSPKTTPPITWPNPSPITYGTALSSTQLNASTVVSGTFSYSPSSGTVMNAGNSQNLNVTFTPADTANYNSASQIVYIDINKKNLAVVADDKSKISGASNPALTATYSGFVNGDTTSALSTIPTLSTTATAGSPVGTYPITASGGVSSNYTFSYTPGTLTVTPSGTLTAGLTADPSNGTVPPGLGTILTASRSGTATGPIELQFRCKVSDAYSSPDPDPEFLCTYSTIGSYTASVIVAQGGISSIASTTINVIADNIPPVITEIITGTTTTSTAVITWTTNESSTSQVEYGTSIAYGNKTPKQLARVNSQLAYANSTVANPSLVTLHSQLLTNLIQNTTYHYRVISIDSLGNMSTSSDQVFTTALPPSAASGETSGWAWSSNIGWISFSSTNSGSFGGLYNVSFDNSAGSTTGKLTNYAWSSNIGWIQFGGLSGFPSGAGTTAIDATINTNVANPKFGEVKGWARAVSAIGRTDGWDGWISLSGNNHHSPDTDSGYTAGEEGVTYYEITTVENGSNVTRGYLRGYAWGGDVVGWIDFAAGAGATTGGGVCIVNCGTSSGSTDFTFNTVQNINVNLANPPAVYNSGLVRVGSLGAYVGIITLSIAPHDGGINGSNLPSGSSASLGSTQCTLGGSNTTCDDISVSISNVTTLGSGYKVKVIATDSSGYGIKETYVPIVIVGPSAKGIHMWLKNPGDANDETTVSRKIRVGQSASIEWKSVSGANKGECYAVFDRNGVPEVIQFNPSIEEYDPGALSVGSYVFTMTCDDLDSGTDYTAKNSEEGDSLVITVTKSKIGEI